jgi:hypothetical protein
MDIGFAAGTSALIDPDRLRMKPSKVDADDLE